MGRPDANLASKIDEHSAAHRTTVAYPTFWGWKWTAQLDIVSDLTGVNVSRTIKQVDGWALTKRGARRKARRAARRL